MGITHLVRGVRFRLRTLLWMSVGVLLALAFVGNNVRQSQRELAIAERLRQHDWQVATEIGAEQSSTLLFRFGDRLQAFLWGPRVRVAKQQGDVVSYEDLELVAQLTSLQQLTAHLDGRLDLLRHLNRLENLVVRDEIAGSLQPLSHLTRLRTLGIDKCRTRSLDELRTLRMLETLHISGGAIDDVSALAQLPKLSRLFLAGVEIADYQPLAHHPTIAALSLSDLSQIDETFLPTLTSLRAVILEGPLISDLAQLRNVKQLGEIQLLSTGVAELSPLQSCKNLYRIYVEDSPVADLQGLSELSQLWSVVLVRTQVTDLSPLSKQQNLRELTVTRSPLHDLWSLVGGRQKVNGSPTLGYPQLGPRIERLNLNDCPVSDIQALEHVRGLSQLRLAGTRVTDVSVLNSLADLRVVYLGRTALDPSKVSVPPTKRYRIHWND